MNFVNDCGNKAFIQMSWLGKFLEDSGAIISQNFCELTTCSQNIRNTLRYIYRAQDTEVYVLTM